MAIYTKISDLEPTDGLSVGDIFVVETDIGTKSVRYDKVLNKDTVIES